LDSKSEKEVINLTASSSLSSSSPQEFSENQKEEISRELEERKDARKIKIKLKETKKKKFDNSGRQFYLAETIERSYLHEPGLEAEPGPPAPTPSSPREWSS
jgi:hypothetical protein